MRLLYVNTSISLFFWLVIRNILTPRLSSRYSLVTSHWNCRCDPVWQTLKIHRSYKNKKCVFIFICIHIHLGIFGLIKVQLCYHHLISKQVDARCDISMTHSYTSFSFAMFQLIVRKYLDLIIVIHFTNNTHVRSSEMLSFLRQWPRGILSEMGKLFNSVHVYVGLNTYFKHLQYVKRIMLKVCDFVI